MEGLQSLAIDPSVRQSQNGACVGSYCCSLDADLGKRSKRLERRFFVQAVEGTNRSVEERLVLCEEVADMDLRAECVSVVLMDRPGPPDDKCPLIPEGRWQDECWFDAAEMRVDHGTMQGLLDIVVGLVVLPMLVVDMWALFWWTESLKRESRRP